MLDTTDVLSNIEHDGDDVLRHKCYFFCGHGDDTRELVFSKVY